jgi:hypothetical protein
MAMRRPRYRNTVTWLVIHSAVQSIPCQKKSSGKELNSSQALNGSQGQLNLFVFSESGANDGNRTNPIGQNKGVTARFSVQLESNGVKLSLACAPATGLRGSRDHTHQKVSGNVPSVPPWMRTSRWGGSTCPQTAPARGRTSTSRGSSFPAGTSTTSSNSQTPAWPCGIRSCETTVCFRAALENQQVNGERLGALQSAAVFLTGAT